MIHRNIHILSPVFFFFLVVVVVVVVVVGPGEDCMKEQCEQIGVSNTSPSKSTPIKYM
jgi:hypothetical protein